MNAELLLAHYERISDAPDAISRLRKFILDLAVRGKLVSQNSSDEPASSIPERIRTENMKRKGAKRKDGHTEPANDDVAQTPFELPSGWTWSRFSDLGAFGRGKSKHRPRNDASLFENGTHFLIQTGDVARSGGLITTYTNKYNEVGLAQSMEWPKGTLCITIAANIADSGILTFDACFPDSVVGFVPDPIFPNARFFEYFVRTAKANLLEFAPATAQKNINLEILNAVLIPLPPLAEQHRIVAKIDELMALCDRLEASRREQEVRREQLTASAHHHLNNGGDAEELRTHAQFFIGHLPCLTTRPDQIKQLRQTILNLAVRGKLLPQDPSDESACIQLKHIQAEKLRMYKEGVLRKERPLTTVAHDEAPFTIPDNWKWIRIGTASLFTDYGTSVKSDHAENGVPVLKMGDIQEGKVLLGGQKKVPSQIDDLPQLFLRRFDLLYNRTNSAELVGKTGIYMGDDDSYTFASYLIRIRFLNELTDAGFVNLSMNAPYFRATQILPELQQQCGQANVNGTKLRSMLIPLAPLAEQHRIVAKVDELMAFCDKLEGSLSTAQTETSRLLDSVLHHALQASA